MLAGSRIISISDSTAFVGFDPPDPEPDDNLSYPSLIKGLTNCKFHDLSSPGAEADFQLIGKLFCGLRGNSSSIGAYMRGLGCDVLNILLGTNDWYRDRGVDRYINGMTSIVNGIIKEQYTQISVSTPFIRYYEGEEPVNSLDEKLSDYCAALYPMVESIKKKQPRRVFKAN